MKKSLVCYTLIVLLTLSISLTGCQRAPEQKNVLEKSAYTQQSADTYGDSFTYFKDVVSFKSELLGNRIARASDMQPFGCRFRVGPYHLYCYL